MSEAEQKPKSFARYIMQCLVLMGVSHALGFFVCFSDGACKVFPKPFGVQVPFVNPVSGYAAISMAIQWVVFIHAVLANTELFYDFTGSCTFVFLTLTGAAGAYTGSITRPVLAAGMVVAWAVRLGTFLLTRVLRAGQDDRFVEFKKRPVRFFFVWCYQGLWVFSTALPLWTLFAAAPASPAPLLAGPATLDGVGLALWVFGFAMEVIADMQKTAWNSDPANKGKFITTGLWSVSRHPNYFGEITLWGGFFLFCAPDFGAGSHWVSLMSPVVVYLMLTRVSGVAMMEAKNDKKWGADPAYQHYKHTVSPLVPFLGGDGDKADNAKRA